MTTTQRPRPQRPSSPAPDPASRGVILVVVAVVLGIILLVRGGGIGFDQDGDELEIGSGGGDTDTAEEVPSTTEPTEETEATPDTSVPPAELQVVTLNAAGIDGYAGQAEQFLNVAGYTSTSAVTAAIQSPDTIVYFADGYGADAFTIAALFGLEAGAVQPFGDEQLVADPAELPATTNVAVLLGPDVQNTVEGAAVNAEGDDAGTTSTTTVVGGG